jgi:hypothetical protein
MSDDLSKLLREWPFEPGKLTCRLITGEDGLDKIQIRLDLGVLQLNADGRPDGQKPFDFPSLLDYFEHELDGPSQDREHAAGDLPADDPTDATQSPEAGGDDPDRGGKQSLTPDDCAALREEAEQYYRRYLALLVLEQYDRVVRDTTRNLRVLDLCRDHAEREEDRTALEELRPLILMTLTRALASIALRDNEPKAAIVALDEGLEALRRTFAESGKPQLFEKSSEVQALRTMRNGLVPKLPVSQKAELKSRLAQAVREENYELAAILRDELKQLPD